MRSVLLLKIQCHIALVCLLMHTYTDRHLFLGILYITASSPTCERNTDTNRDEGFPPQTLPISQRKDLNFLRQTVWYVAVSFAFFLQPGQCPSAL